MEKLYWKFRKFINYIIFIIKKMIFYIERYLYNKRLYRNFNKDILKEVVKKVLINLLIIIVAFKLDELFMEIIKDNFKFDIVLKNDLEADLLIAIVGVAGVFLGLYCSNLMSIFSSKYSNAPEQLARLFENDILNNKSIRLIANYLIFNILVLIFNSFTQKIGILLLVITVVQGVWIIVSYGFFGRRTFQLSNIYHVTDSVYVQIFRNMKIMQRKSFFSQDSNFQSYLNKSTKRLIEYLNIVNDFCIELKENNSSSMEEFVNKNLSLINFYWKIKADINYDSFWYTLKPVYKKWYSASDNEIMMAISTGASIGYKNEKDYFWFEDQLMKINNKCFSIFLKSYNYPCIYRYINTIDNLSEDAVKSGNLTYYLNEIKRIQNQIVKLLCESARNIELSEEIALVELIINVYIGVILNIKRYLQDIKVETILNDSINFLKISRSNKSKKYYNYKDTKLLYKQIEAEVKLENEQITPNWYIKQNIAKHIYDDILNLHFEIDKIMSCYIPQFIDKLEKNKKYAGSMIIYSKMSEIKVKLQDTLPILKEHLINLEKYHIDKENVWTENRIEKFDEITENYFYGLPGKWSKCASFFTIEHWKELDSYPDLLGECYNYLCEFLIEQLEKCNLDNFYEGYKDLWGLALVYQDISRKELIEIMGSSNQQAVYAVYSNPILDCCYISGYAYILGELVGENKWRELMIKMFDDELEKITKDKSNICERFISILDMRDNLLPALYNRDLIHTNWKSRIENSIYKMDVLKWKRERFMNVLVTDNDLLKAVIGYQDSIKLIHCDAYEIFAIKVLNKYVEEDKKFVSKSGWERRLKNE